MEDYEEEQEGRKETSEIVPTSSSVIMRNYTYQIGYQEVIGSTLYPFNHNEN